jgi:acetyl esterase/lipase
MHRRCNLSRLKNLPPALILSTEDDPLRDEAEQYGAKLVSCGVTTTVTRMQPARCTKSGRVTNVRANATHWEKSPASSLVWNGLVTSGRLELPSLL